MVQVRGLNGGPHAFFIFFVHNAVDQMDTGRKILIVVMAACLMGLGPYGLGAAIVLTPCAFLGWKLRDHVPSRRRKKQLEKEATSALFQIGNRMVSGATFERALQEAAEGMKGTPFQEFARSLLYRSRLFGRPVDEMIAEEGSLRAASRVVENAYITVVQCAARDPRYAGQIALNLAHMSPKKHRRRIKRCP